MQIPFAETCHFSFANTKIGLLRTPPLNYKLTYRVISQ